MEKNEQLYKKQDLTINTQISEEQQTTMDANFVQMLQSIEEQKTETDLLQITPEYVKKEQQANELVMDTVDYKKIEVSSDSVNLNGMSVPQTTEDNEQVTSAKAIALTQNITSLNANTQTLEKLGNNLSMSDRQKLLERDAENFRAAKEKERKALQGDDFSKNNNNNTSILLPPKYAKLQSFYTRLKNDTDSSTTLFQAVRTSFDNFFARFVNSSKIDETDPGFLADYQSMVTSVHAYYTQNKGFKFTKKGSRRRDLTDEMGTELALLQLSFKDPVVAPDLSSTVSAEANAFVKVTKGALDDLNDLSLTQKMYDSGNTALNSDLSKEYNKLFKELLDFDPELIGTTTDKQLLTADRSVFRFYNILRHLRESKISTEGEANYQFFEQFSKTIPADEATYLKNMFKTYSQTYDQINKLYSINGIDINTGEIIPQEKRFGINSLESAQQKKLMNITNNQLKAIKDEKSTYKLAHTQEKARKTFPEKNADKIASIYKNVLTMVESEKEREWYEEKLNDDVIVDFLVSNILSNFTPDDVINTDNEVLAYMLYRKILLQTKYDTCLTPEIQERLMTEQKVKKEDFQREFAFVRPVRITKNGEFLEEIDRQNHLFNQRFVNSYLENKPENRYDIIDEIVEKSRNIKITPDMFSEQYIFSHAKEFVSMSEYSLCTSNILTRDPANHEYALKKGYKQIVVEGGKEKEQEVITKEASILVDYINIMGNVLSDTRAFDLTNNKLLLANAKGKYIPATIATLFNLIEKINNPAYVHRVSQILLNDNRANKELCKAIDEINLDGLTKLADSTLESEFEKQENKEKILAFRSLEQNSAQEVESFYERTKSEMGEQFEKKLAEARKVNPNANERTVASYYYFQKMNNAQLSWVSKTDMKEKIDNACARLGISELAQRLIRPYLYDVDKNAPVSSPEEQKKKDWNEKYINSILSNDEESMKARYECLNDIVDRTIALVTEYPMLLNDTYLTTHPHEFYIFLDYFNAASIILGSSEHRQFWSDLAVNSPEKYAAFEKITRDAAEMSSYLFQKFTADSGYDPASESFMNEDNIKSSFSMSEVSKPIIESKKSSYLNLLKKKY